MQSAVVKFNLIFKMNVLRRTYTYRIKQRFRRKRGFFLLKTFRLIDMTWTRSLRTPQQELFIRKLFMYSF